MRNTCRIDEELLKELKKEKRKHNAKFNTDQSLGSFMDKILRHGLARYRKHMKNIAQNS